MAYPVIKVTLLDTKLGLRHDTNLKLAKKNSALAS